MDQVTCNREVSKLTEQLRELDGELEGLRRHNADAVVPDHFARGQMDAVLGKIKLFADRRDRLKVIHGFLEQEK
jgi:hypothetical protein